ncbi:MAG: family 43 glycosylhydrolase [Bacteroidetes bacterium]|nr:family 43 glycosylhydrolase [Bacteroidota bacterium]
MKNKTFIFILVIVLVISYVDGKNPIIRDVFTADPAPMVYKGKVYLYVGHDTATVDAKTYKMPDWLVYSSSDMVNWKSHGPCLSVKDFAWASYAANAAHCIERNGKFYWYISIIHKANTDSKGGVAIGVAVSDSPTGPFKDAIGKALVTNDMTTDMKHAWDDLDPAVFIDDNGQAYLFWGNGSCKWVKLKENMIELDGPIHTFKPQNFTEAPWVYKRKGLYYLVYAANFPETIEYCTAESIEGPWAYRGLIQDRSYNSSTTHPGIIDFKGKTYYFYHDGSLPTGGDYRRSVCVEYLHYNPDGTIQKIVQTKEGVKAVNKK